MSDIPQTFQARYYARLFLLFGFLLLIFMVALSALQPYIRYRNAQGWIATEATVLAVNELCDVELKVGKDWRKEATLPCGETERFIAERRTTLKSSWQTIPREYVQISYAAAGETRTQSVRRLLVAAEPVKPNDRIGIVVDPAHPMVVDRPPVAEDFAPVWRVGIGGLVMAVVLALVGWLGGRYNDRRAAEKGGG